MTYERPQTEYSSAAAEVLDPYGLLESDGEQEKPSTEYDEPYSILSEREASQYHSVGNDVAGRELTAQEQRLGHHWSSLLQLDGACVKPEDNFFDLGGTSVQALMLGAATHDDGLLLAVPDVFRNPTLLEMARAVQLQDDKVDDHGQETPAFSLVVDRGSIEETRVEVERQCGISQGMIEDIYPCAPLQKGLMALSMLKPGAYLEQHVYSIPKSWDLASFQTAWHALATCNPILRTRIIQTEQCGWVQVLDRSEIEWTAAVSLESYLQMDRNKTMSFGDPLVRCALIDDATDVCVRFVLTLHHAVQDGWSMKLLPKKITEAYGGSRSNAGARFKDFIKHIEELDYEASKNYWRCELGGSNQSTFPRLPSATYEPLANRRITRTLPLSRDLPSSITISTMIRAAWSMIVARYMDSSDVTIGVTMSGRSVPISGITEMLGPTIATMPVRVRLDTNQKVQEFLETIQRQATEMITHEQYGLQNIQSITNDASMACKFQNLLIIQPMDESPECNSDVGTLREIPMDFPNYLTYALTVECILMPDALKVEMGFDMAVIDELQIGRVLQQFEHVLCQIHTRSNWEKCLNDIELISPSDKEEIMQWNREVPAIEEVCVHQLIEQESLKHPDSSAICSWDGDMSYAKLDDLAGRLAPLLVRNGIGPETFVPLCFEKSLWTVVAMLAVLKAGGAFVLLDPSQPWNRLKRIINLVQAKVALASPQQLELLSTIGTNIIVVELSTIESLPRGNCPLDVKVNPSNALYVTFTSGSTGEPKGSVTEHVSCSSAFTAQIKAKHFQCMSRVLQFASYSFDTSIEEILATLMVGGCICIPEEKERLSDLPGAINRMGVNLAELTTSAASLLTPESVPNLEILRQGGEPMSAALINRWAGVLQLENSYGPSECCVTTTIQKITPNTDPTNIGKGLGCRLWIAEFSDYTTLAPIGTIGELLIQGPNVARGYVNRDLGTATAFIDNPLLPQSLGISSRRLYKTGDVARYNSDGTVSILGRKDAQVKLRGQRIELGEIEHHLSAIDAVARSIVIKPKIGSFRDSLVAVIQLRDGPGKLEDHSTLRSISNDELPGLDDTAYGIRRTLEMHLPSYMVPTTWIVVDHLPSLMTGKTNRSAVAEWLGSVDPQEKLAVQVAAFPSALPTTLANSESTALRLSAKLADLISNGDEQFRSSLEGKDVLLQTYGINSISVVTLASFIKQAFGVTLGIDILTDSSLTVRNLAKHIENAEAGIFGAGRSTKIDLVRELSEMQQSLLKMTESSKCQESASAFKIETIFVTGATGYLGTHILRAALLHPQTKRVITHVRAKTPYHGLQRLINSATTARWWVEGSLSKLEVWTGDLSDEHLGLTVTQWEELSGTSPTNRKVDAIIHNGAAVNWYKDYAALKPANVTSTLDLLCATASSPFLQKFVYVSGGPQWDDGEDNDDDESLMKQIADSNGYCQTKIISELLAKNFARSSERNKKRMSIVKPGYIVGTVAEGIGNIDDFLWRVVAGVVGIEGVSREDMDLWIFLATVDSVAEVVLGSVLQEENEFPTLTKILDGLTVGELWSTISTHFNYNLRQMDHEEWCATLRRDVDRSKQKHPLWPVIHLIGQGQSSLGSKISPTQREVNSIGKGYIQSAIVSNVEYLIRIGFLPGLKGEEVAMSVEAKYSRSQLVV